MRSPLLFGTLLITLFLAPRSALTQGEGTERESGKFRTARKEMLDEQIIQRGIEDERVIEAMKKVPRHRFVPPDHRGKAYGDHPLPIGQGQTISQPYVVALMTEKLSLQGGEKVLEIGTGSGYQAAILGELAKEVHSVEIRKELAEGASATLKALGYENVHVHHGDGYEGWPEAAPYDAIIVTAAPEKVPEALKGQLAKGGRMILPVGDLVQKLRLIRKDDQGKISQKKLSSVQFVPMIHESND